MKSIFLFIALAFSITSFAQKEIKLEEAKNHIGDSVKLRGKVFGIKYLEGAKNPLTFINLGAAYPDQLLTVVISGDVRKKFEIDLADKKYANGMAVVTGKIELHKEKPQIVIGDPGQIVFIVDEEIKK